jgi:TRAP-type C4-dicarboxylate transport system permease small subunit
MKRLEHILVRMLETSFSICFLIMFALVVTQVALRYGFNESIGGANELATILFAYTSALGIAVGIAKRDHMAISWFTERLPPKARKVIDVVGLVLLAILNIVIFWYSLRWIDITGSRMISVLHVPRWTAQIAIPIGTGASAIFCFIKLWLGLKGDEELGVPWMQDD